MILRFALLAALALGLALDASAQITLRADQALPYLEGTNTLISYESADDGSQEAAITALIAQSGPNQTWDFSGIAQLVGEGIATTTEGATGPGQGVSPYDQATRSYELVLPPQADEDGNVISGTVYGYVRLDGDGLYNLGIVLTSEFDGQQFSLAAANLPDGSLVAPSTFTFGSSWESTFVFSNELFGNANTRHEYEVDEWGTLIVPGGISAPALRVKLTDTNLDDGSVDVSYEIRTAGALAANLDPDEFGLGSTASLTIVTSGGGSTNVSDGPDDGFEVGAPWPNPARASVALEVTAPQAGAARVAVYDVLGRQAIATTSRTVPAGTSRVDLDTSDLPAGVYVIRVEVEARSFARSLTVVR
ncbi:T9SS type A sorting domain-containing protein [Rubrivirga sp.]|uniref:T9SS type A sorting domain-containing protein n=1 Tax=Rubrivirga sp. TaxID=1885344 RepID=UPI003C78A142